MGNTNRNACFKMQFMNASGPNESFEEEEAAAAAASDDDFAVSHWQ